MAVCLTIILLLVTGALISFGRDIQRQVDNLDRRYENDYVYVKDNLRELWDSIDQLETVCRAGTKTSQETKSVSPIAEQSPLRHENAVVHSPVYVSQLEQGLSDEKKFLRKSLKDITDSINQINSSLTSTETETKNHVSEIDDRCSGVENEVEQLHTKQAVMFEKIEKMEHTMKSETDELRLVINQALEEVMQNSNFDKATSCIDLVKAGVTTSGVYTLHYRMQPFIVYCLMTKSGGYSFISPDTYINVDIKRLSNDHSHVIIRHRRTDGLQYESRIEQISRYKSRPISVQYNAHTGYKGVVNNKMTPYIYVGLNPLKLDGGRSHKGDRQGYKSNGKEFTFVNCDGNPNGYFVFFFNHNNVAAPRRGESRAISRKWIDSSTRVTGDTLPDKFMSFFELHFGGCGAYVATNNIGEVTGASVGIPFNLS